MRLAPLLLFAVLPGCSGLGLTCYNGQCGEVPLGALLMEPEEGIDFGKVRKNTEAEPEELVLVADGGRTALVEVYFDNTSSDAFSLGKLPLPRVLSPDEEFPVEISFTPYSNGEFNGTLIVHIDGANGEEELPVVVQGVGCEGDAC
jgi:hypothetical protein